MGIYSPIADNSFTRGYFEVSTAEAAVVTSVGEVSAFAKDSDPAGYLLCDGREVSRADYPELFAAIGTKYGEGDGETTFNLPRLTDGRFIEGSTEAGEYKEAGLPNITGSISGHIAGAGGAFQGGHKSIPWGQAWSGSDFYHYEGNFDASGSNPIYGKSDTVQPEALTMRYFIKATSKIQEDVTVDKDFTVHGHTDLKGDVRMEDGLQVKGDTHIDGNQEVDKNQTIHGNQTVDGDSRIHGNQVIDKDASVYGSTDLKGDLRVENNAQILGDTQLGDDKNKDKVDVWAKTHLHGDTTVGDDASDKFVVNATSEFKANVTFDKDVHIAGNLETDGNSVTHGNQTVDGDSHIKGNQSVDGDSVVGGNATVKGSMEINGDETVHGNSIVEGDFHTKGNAEVDKDLAVHGNATVDGNLTTKGDAYTLGNSVIGKDLTVGGDSHLGGDLVLDGKFFAKGAAAFGDSVDIAKNLTVGGNSHVVGDSVVDGDSYARSFNIGNEKYIDSNGINANGHKIRNVADGEISPNSLDAVNGRQLWHTREGLQHNINQVGAGAAAMANLHPLEFEHDDKFSVSAAVGNYKDQTSLAAGVYYRPNIKSLISLSGTMGNSENMFGVGYSAKFGKVSEFGNMTEDQLRDKVSELNDSNKALKAKEADLEKNLSDVTKAYDQLMTKNSDMEKSYSQLMSKVDGLVSELATLKAESQK